MNYYLPAQASHFYLTSGLDLGSARASQTASDSSTYRQLSGARLALGAGYEYRGGDGFLFRASPYLLAGVSGLSPTAGFSFGVAY